MVCALCGTPAFRGALKYLVSLDESVTDSKGFTYPAGSHFHGSHIVVIGPVCREQFAIPEDVREITVAALVGLKQSSKQY